MANVAEKIAKRIQPTDPLQAVLRQQSRAYGTVAGALENYAGFVARGQASDPAGRQAFGELINAIHEPRPDALLIATRLATLAVEVQS